MVRPLDADARRFSDLYRFSFPRSPGGCDCATADDITLRLPENGDGKLGSIRTDFEVDRDGRIVGELAARSFSAVLVSPGGE
jgi:hypothetical protein